MWYKFYVRKRTSDISPSLLWFSAAWHWKTHLYNRSYLLLYRTRFITVYQAHFVFLDTTSNYFSRDRRDKNSFNLNVKQKISIDLESPLLAFRESNIPFSREGGREREKRERAYHRWKFESIEAIDRLIKRGGVSVSSWEKRIARSLATRDFTLRGSINYSLGRRRQGMGGGREGASEKRKHGGIV